MSALDMQSINREIFHDGNISVSPAELVMLNNKPPVPYKASFISGGADSGYKVYLSGYAQHVLKSEKQYSMTSVQLERALNQLRSFPRPVMDGYGKKGSVDTRLLSIPTHKIMYKIISGQIHVYNIVANDALAEARAKLEKPALYKIAKDGNGNWKNKGKVNEVSTDYAAVNGQSNVLGKATWLMGLHLDHAYGKSSVVKEFTLYHNPSESGLSDTWESFRDKLGFTTDVTKGLSGILKQTQAAGKDVKWVVHSQGAIIFSEAVRYVLNGDSSWAIFGGFNGIFRDDKGTVLDKHSVTLHGNGNNELRSSVLFERAGVKVLGYNSHPYDMVSNLAGLNVSSVKNFIGSLVYSGHVFGGSVQQSPHTLPYKGFDNWDNEMTNGPGKGRNKIQSNFKAITNNLK